ncbi:NAD(P)-binding protein [Mycena leptocephala]|nr:NAD(P)-binding protein [Mycena leptocephala]
MPDLSTVRKFNTAWAPAYTPVGIFVGGTSGIGQGIAEAFARHTKGNAHIVIVGRSSAAATAILAGLPPAPAGADATRDFVPCDLTSIASVKRVTASLGARFPRINLLVTTAGTINFESKTTSEGLEVSTALLYYARWALVGGLLPTIRAAHAAGEDARVMAVFSAGQGKELDLSDLGLKKVFKPIREFNGFRTAGNQASTYIDLMFKDYAARNPGITFVHAHPGLVDTPLLKTVALNPDILTPDILATAKSIEVCGEHQLYALLKAPAGASRTGQDGDDIGMDLPATEEVQRTLWEHTEKAIGGIE